MIPEGTRQQIAALQLGGRPLIICDVDEVVVHFTREFEDQLEGHDLYLAPDSFALNGNVRRKHDNAPVGNDVVMHHISRVFEERTLTMQPIEGAIGSLGALAAHADIVLLTNLPHEAGEMRRDNLKGLGLPHPVVTNSGPKGPAVRCLADMAGGTVVFIDDSPQFLASAHEHAPEVRLVHFLHDERFARHVPEVDYVSLRTDSWERVLPHVLGLILAGSLD
jgi:hypothetical protein